VFKLFIESLKFPLCVLVQRLKLKLTKTTYNTVLDGRKLII